MKMRLSLLAALLGCSFPLGCAASTTAQADEAAITKDIKDQAGEYAKAFAKGDAKSLAAMWTTDGVYMDESGRRFSGRGEIEKAFAELFAGKGGRPLEVKVDEVKVIGKDVVLENGTGSVVSPGLPQTCSRYSAVHVKRDGKWLMNSVTEAPCAVPTAGLKDLDWLVGEWIAKGKSGEVQVKSEWAGDKNFIRSVFTSRNGDGSQSTQMQIIGWDPRTQHLASWHFDSAGGVGYDTWYKSGDSWLVDANSVSKDGRRGHALNTVRRVDANSFAWKSTNRVLDGQELPDTEEVKIERAK